jgi:hypothetical protein
MILQLIVRAIFNRKFLKAWDKNFQYDCVYERLSASVKNNAI